MLPPLLGTGTNIVTQTRVILRRDQELYAMDNLDANEPRPTR